MRKIDYMNISLNRDINLFNWKSDDIKLPRDPEFYNATYGCLGYSLKDNKWVRGHFTGILDEFGDFTTFVGLELSSMQEDGGKELKNHTEVVVCRNNPLMIPNTVKNDWFASLREENDKSLMALVLMTRLSKAIVTFSDQQKKQIEAAFKNIKDGLPVVFTSSIIEELNTIDLTDVKDVDKIQYLSSFMQEIDKREANLKGIDLELLDKRAQVTSNELKQYDDITSLDYLIMYNERLRFMEEMKENGINIEITRSPIFFDEPTKEDIESGEFEAKEAEELPEEETKEEDTNNEENSEANQ